MQHQVLNLDQMIAYITADSHFLTQIEPDNSKRKMHELIQFAIQKELTDKQRVCLQMYYFDGLRMQEIADRTSVAISTVSRHISSAKVRLKKILRYSLYLNESTTNLTH